MSDDGKRGRARPLVAGMRVTQVEMAALRAAAAESAMSVSDYLRSRALTKR